MTLAKNATIYRVTGMSGSSLAAACEGRPFIKCNPTDAFSSGFVPPLKSSPDLLIHSAGGIHGFAFRLDTKILPAAVINAAAQERVKEIEEEQGRKVGKKELRELKEDMAIKLLQVAFIKTQITRGWFDNEGKLFVIDSSSQSRCDDILGAIHKGNFESDAEFKFEPVWSGIGVSACFSAWIASGEAPEGFTIDDSAKFMGPDHIKVNAQNMSMADENIHGIAGRLACIELAMTHDDKISFKLTQDLMMKGINLIGIDRDSALQGDLLESEKADAELVVCAGLVRNAAEAVVLAIGI